MAQHADSGLDQRKRESDGYANRYQAPSFAVIEAILLSTVNASRCKVFEPQLVISSETAVSTVLDSVSRACVLSADSQLFRYLRADAAPYHYRAVELLWEYNRLAKAHTLEGVIARRLGSTVNTAEAFEAFGILWRYTGKQRHGASI